jgi:hypothetical protein
MCRYHKCPWCGHVWDMTPRNDKGVKPARDNSIDIGLKEPMMPC